jgi:hypothetical protein
MAVGNAAIDEQIPCPWSLLGVQEIYEINTRQSINHSTRSPEEETGQHVQFRCDKDTRRYDEQQAEAPAKRNFFLAGGS